MMKKVHSILIIFLLILPCCRKSDENRNMLDVARKKYTFVNDFLNSLRGKDTWTFFIGHSAQPDESRGYVGIDFTDGYLAKSIASSNKFAGVFACESADYAFPLITGPIVFAVDSRGDRSSAHGLAQSGYSVIRSLIMGKAIGHAAVGGSLSLSTSGHPQDLRDKIVVRDPK